MMIAGIDRIEDEDKRLKDCARMASAAGALNTYRPGPMEGDISLENLDHLIGGEP